MFLKILACEVAFREICWATARSASLVDLEFLSQGYHDNSDIGRERLQERIDAVPEGKFDALLLGYALCNNMVVEVYSYNPAILNFFKPFLIIAVVG